MGQMSPDLRLPENPAPKANAPPTKKLAKTERIERKKLRERYVAVTVYSLDYDCWIITYLTVI